MTRIKIIDDDVDLADDLAMLLKAKGFSVSTFNQTEGAVEVLLEDRPDLLILDVMFPENVSGGFDLAREIRGAESLQDLPIIMLTGVNQIFPMDFSSDDIDPNWMPVQDFLEKPVDLDALLEKIDSLLKKKAGE